MVIQIFRSVLTEQYLKKIICPGFIFTAAHVCHKHMRILSRNNWQMSQFIFKELHYRVSPENNTVPPSQQEYQYYNFLY